MRWLSRLETHNHTIIHELNYSRATEGSWALLLTDFCGYFHLPTPNLCSKKTIFNYFNFKKMYSQGFWILWLSPQEERRRRLAWGSFALQMWFLLSSESTPVEWSIQEREKLENVQGKERKFLNSHGWAMYCLFLGFRLWQVGFSYKPKNYMDEAAKMTQENS